MRPDVPRRLVLVDPNPEMCGAWTQAFSGAQEVGVLEGRIEELPACDCLVSPGNGFGLMDGGVDAALARLFGEDVVRSVQQRILDDYLGEQPVGTCIIIETGSAAHPFLAHAPTMRIPMTIDRTDDVYLAMRAVLAAVHRHNRDGARRIDSIALPGLGAGAGGMRCVEAARQMALAWQHAKSPPLRLDWSHAERVQAALRRGGDYWLREGKGE